MNKKELIKKLRETKSEQMDRFEKEIENYEKLLFDMRYNDISEVEIERRIIESEYYELAQYIIKPSNLFKSLIIAKRKR